VLLVDDQPLVQIGDLTARDHAAAIVFAFDHGLVQPAA
jgi:hypothetical protein